MDDMEQCLTKFGGDEDYCIITCMNIQRILIDTFKVYSPLLFCGFNISFKHSLAFLEDYTKKMKEGLYTEQILQQKRFAPNNFVTRSPVHQTHIFYTRGFHSMDDRLCGPKHWYLQCCLRPLKEHWYFVVLEKLGTPQTF